MKTLITALKIARAAAGGLKRAAAAALDLARRLVIYACLAAVLIADRIAQWLKGDAQDAE